MTGLLADSAARRRLAIAATVLVLLGAGAVWWLSGADERRVDGACDTWLQHRGSLRSLLDETVEAAERARADGSSETSAHFNDLDSTMEWLERWQQVSPSALESLERGDDASRLERGAVAGLEVVQTGLDELEQMIERGDPDEVIDLIPEVRARFQMVDDACLSAARQRGL